MTALVVVMATIAFLAALAVTAARLGLLTIRLAAPPRRKKETSGASHQS